MKGNAFKDDSLPNNFVPFNVQNIAGNLYVSFAQQDAAKFFIIIGAGLGAVDVFSPDGALLRRLETGSWFNAPYGLTLAPSDFTGFSHSVLVGQFGSGEILAFDAVTGSFQGKLRNQENKVFSIFNIQGIAFGAGIPNSGASNELFFNAAPDGIASGLFGSIVPVTADLTQGNDQ